MRNRFCSWREFDLIDLEGRDVQSVADAPVERTRRWVWAVPCGDRRGVDDDVRHEFESSAVARVLHSDRWSPTRRNPMTLWWRMVARVRERGALPGPPPAGDHAGDAVVTESNLIPAPSDEMARRIVGPIRRSDATETRKVFHSRTWLKAKHQQLHRSSQSASARYCGPNRWRRLVQYRCRPGLLDIMYLIGAELAEFKLGERTRFTMTGPRRRAVLTVPEIE